MWRRGWVRVLVGGTVAVVALLFVPDYEPDPQGAGAEPFVWGQDALFERLARDFERESALNCQVATERIEAQLVAFRSSLEALTNPDARPPSPDDRRFDELELRLFVLAASFGACPQRLPEFAELVFELRRRAKQLSQHWDVTQRPVRDRLYRLLYGSRAALEELLLASPAASVPAVLHGTDEPSATPSAELQGVRVHSGDILLSRGGAPTSALISRGNDHPGNFSHVALVHVDEDGTLRTIEAHIEVGVVVAGVDRYLGDRKLRVMLLRLRADVPELVADPMLPHHAASDARRAAEQRHIPYDFAMHYDDDSAQFCSEVASAAYAKHGVRLWEGLTSMSSPGLVRWLSALGVERFTTHGPSDLEYDPKLRVVAEWRDPSALFDDHVDNAVIDALLEAGDEGLAMGHDPLQLPLARLAKAYSVVLNWLGRVGPIPEGMSATVGLRVQWLRDRHAETKADILRDAEAYEQTTGHRPPYWELVRMARESVRRWNPAGAE